MRLSDWLRETETTQEAFGAEIGVTQGRVSQIIRGDVPPVDLLLKIIKATKGAVSLKDFDYDGVLGR